MNYSKIVCNLVLIFISFTFLIKSNLVAQGTRRSDSLALVDLYNATGGANWTNKWDLTQPLLLPNGLTNTQYWKGITHNTEESIINITLPNNNLIGTLVDLNMPQLEVLRLDSNAISGAIPNYNLPKLRNLNLAKNILSQSIPNFNLPNLEFLTLYENQLSGEIPNFNLPNIVGIYISNNALSGQLPNLSLPKLQELYAYNNNFRGSSIPNFILSELRELSFFNCQMNTQLPLFNSTPKLKKLYLSFNQLIGTIPNFNLPNLQVLYLNDNKLSGELPFINTGQMMDIRFQNNQLSGCFPVSYKKYCSITEPSNLNFSGNIGLPNNGDFTAFCVSNSGVCQDTNSCRYQDSIALVRLFNATDGQNWTPTYRWDFSKSMENWKGVGLNAQGCVECLDLDGDASICNGWSDNPLGVGLSGTFPTAIGKLTNLYRLHLRGNRNLTGSIPDSIRYLTKLEALYLDGTGVGGPFPDGFRGLINLLDFSGYNTPYNNIIPDFFSNIKNLEVFDFSDSQASGAIPPSLVKSDSMRRLFLARNKMTGTVPIELASRSMHRLDLSDNDFDSLPKLNLVKWDVPFVGDPFVFLQGNRFTFDDIVPNIKSLSTDFAKTYAPQDSIFRDTTITLSTGCDLFVDLKIDATIPNNTYKWYQGTNFKYSNNSNKLILRGVQASDAGVYTCQVTNSDAPLLTLYSRKITLRVNVLTPITQNRAICQGQSYTLPSGKIVSTANTYRDTLKAINGCDSAVIITNLSVNSVISTPLSRSICSGQTYTLPKGRIVSTAGTYRDTLKSVGGCDSVIVTTLSIDSKITIPITKTICSGQTYTLANNRFLFKAGVYVDSLKTVGGCDSIIILTLNVSPALSSTINKSICQRQTYVLPKGRIVSAAGVYRDTLKNATGCDSIIVTTLSITPPAIEKVTQRTCSGVNYRLSNGSIATKGGIYRDTLRSASGCDTILEITLILDTIKVIKEDTLCSGQKYRLPSGKEVTELTTHRDIVKRQGQCDTIYFITLTEGCLTRLKIFNGLTPDGAFNRNFVVEGIEDYPQAKLLIYTRTNDLIFQSKGSYKNDWNGTDSNGTPLPADTYYYILDLGIPNQKPLQGYILLAR